MNTNSQPNFLLRLKSYPWIVITFCALFLFYKYVLQVSPSVITHDLMRRYQLSGAGLGNLAATFFYAYLVIQLFAGPMLDRLGARLLTALAILLCAVGTIWFSDASTLLQAIFARVLVGAGAAFATVSYLKIAAMWFEPKKFAFVSGLLASAAMVGSMCGQLPFALMVVHFGSQSSLFYCGVFGIALAILFYVVVRGDRRDLSPKTKLEIEQPLTLRDIMTVLKFKPNWALMFYSGLAFSPLAVFAGLWGDSFLQTAYHITKPDAAMLTSMSFLGLAIGAPVLGFLSDRLSSRFGIMLAGMLLSIAMLMVALYSPFASHWIEGTALFFFGFGTGAFMIVFSVGKDVNPIAMTATVVAFINTGDALIGTFTEPLLGKFLDIFGHGKMLHGIRFFSLKDYHMALLLLPLYLIAGLVCLLLVKKTIQGK
jgi:nitrate/nitrite transporter NarK